MEASLKDYLNVSKKLLPNRVVAGLFIYLFLAKGLCGLIKQSGLETG